MRLSCLALLVQAAVANDADVATQECLDNQDLQCTEECPPRRVYSRACLVSKVPFRTPYGRVKCCLRCCLKYWLKEYGLDRRWAAFRAEQGGAGRIDEPIGDRPKRQRHHHVAEREERCSARARNGMNCNATAWADPRGDYTIMSIGRAGRWAGVACRRAHR